MYTIVTHFMLKVFLIFGEQLNPFLRTVKENEFRWGSDQPKIN